MIGSMDTPCIPHPGHIRPVDGYGIHWSGRMAHRVAWEAEVGPIPEGLELDHLCRVRSCINVAHLEPVTRAENMRRAGLAKRQDRCKRDHDMAVTARAKRGGGRYCGACRVITRRAKAGRELGSPCGKGHEYDRQTKRGVRCSTCQSEAGRAAILKRWHGDVSH